MNLQEEVDTLRVQTAQDAATIHELKVCLEQEREGRVHIVVKVMLYIIECRGEIMYKSIPIKIYWLCGVTFRQRGFCFSDF